MFLWRPRPETFLSKEEQKQVRKNLREYSKEFKEEDRYAIDIANTVVVEKRRRILKEWVAWIRREKEILSEEKNTYGCFEKADDPNLAKDTPAVTEDKGETVVEEIVEEIVKESEETIV
jgi:translation initiation factor 3 subunit B